MYADTTVALGCFTTCMLGLKSRAARRKQRLLLWLLFAGSLGTGVGSRNRLFCGAVMGICANVMRRFCRSSVTSCAYLELEAVPACGLSACRWFRRLSSSLFIPYFFCTFCALFPSYVTERQSCHANFQSCGSMLWSARACMKGG